MSKKVQNNPRTYKIHLSPQGIGRRFVPRHAHKFRHEWFFAISGGGVQIVKDWEHEVALGELIFIPAKSEHVFFMENTHGCFCNVFMQPLELFGGSDIFDESAKMIISQLIRHVEQNGYNLKLPPTAHQQCLKILEQINNCTNNRDALSYFEIKSLTSQLLLAVAAILPIKRVTREDIDSQQDYCIDKLLAHINGNYHEKITIDDALKISGLNRSNFHVRFQKHTGETFCRYLNALRLLAVNNMLESGLKLEVAIKASGFSSKSNYYEQRRNLQI